jgi:ADP-heptose:LPS heptosyltransferase
VTLEPHVAVTDADVSEARGALGDLSGAYIVLQVGAHDPRRRWPAERYAAVGDHLARQGYRIVVAGGSDVADLAQAVVSGMSHTAQSAAGTLSLGGTAGLLSRAALVISNDSGPLHLAHAVGAASVGLYWVGNLLNFGALYRERHMPLVSWTIRCPECGVPCMQGNLPGETAPRCEHVSCFITDISVEAVTAAADRVLQTTLDRKAEQHGQVTAQDR